MLPCLLILSFTFGLSSALSGHVTRFDDILVFNETSIEFEPVGGLNDTTRDTQWRKDYLANIDMAKLKASQTQLAAMGDVESKGEVHTLSASDCVNCLHI